MSFNYSALQKLWSYKPTSGSLCTAEFFDNTMQGHTSTKLHIVCNMAAIHESSRWGKVDEEKVGSNVKHLH